MVILVHHYLKWCFGSSPLKTCQLPNPKSPWLHVKQQLLVTDGLADANINSIDTEAEIVLDQY